MSKVPVQPVKESCANITGQSTHHLESRFLTPDSGVIRFLVLKGMTLILTLILALVCGSCRGPQDPHGASHSCTVQLVRQAHTPHAHALILVKYEYLALGEVARGGNGRGAGLGDWGLRPLDLQG